MGETVEEEQAGVSVTYSSSSVEHSLSSVWEVEKEVLALGRRLYKTSSEAPVKA